VRQGEEPGPAVSEVEQARESLIRFDYTAGAPAAVTEAMMRLITREQLRRADDEGADSYDEEEESPFFLTLPTVKMANTSDKNIREVGVGFETNGTLNCIAGYTASIKPGESQTFRSDWRRRNVIIPGTFADVSVRVVWVTFEDGTQWGARARDPQPPQPPPPPRVAAPAEPDAPTLIGAGRASDAPRASGGVGLGVGGGEGAGTASGGGAGKGRGRGGQKLYAPQPSYPPVAKAAGAEGEVSVKIMVDEDGNVVAAEAVSGHPLLRTAAVDAAREAKFKPTFIDGKPVKVSGVLSYVFKLKKNPTQ
jgi:TonB family protein